MSRLAKARRLFANGNKHLAKLGRPGRQKKRSAEQLAARELRLRRRKAERQARGAKF